jgi:hypothetical protein
VERGTFEATVEREVSPGVWRVRYGHSPGALDWLRAAEFEYAPVGAGDKITLRFTPGTPGRWRASRSNE